MEKRLPLALILSFAFVLLYLRSFPQPEATEPGAGDPAFADETNTGAPSSGATGASAIPPAGFDPSADNLAGALADEAEVALEDLLNSEVPQVTEVLETHVSRSQWTSQGASLVQLDLLDYHPSLESDDVLPLLSKLDGETNNLRLIALGDKYALDRVQWEVRREKTSEGYVRLVFTHTTADGLLFTRTVEESGRDYILGLTVEVTNVGTTRLDSLSLSLEGARGIVDLAAGTGKFNYGHGPQAVAIVRNKIGDHEPTKWSGGDLDGEPLPIGVDEQLLAAGVMTNYFTSVLVPSPDTDVRQVFPASVFDAQALDRKVAELEPRDEREAEARRYEFEADFRTNATADLLLVVLGLEPGQTRIFDFDLYAGPKSTEMASEAGYGFLTDVIEASYGWGAWINRTLLLVLRFFHSIVGNWGLAIIMLTVLVKGMLFPLNRKQQTGMGRYSAAMQRLKPRLDELKKKHKNNTRKFQEEQMKLLKAEGVSPPLGGCMLMFLQFPVWISLFQILGTSIELRQSSFMFWITDLSRPDQMPFGFFGFETLNLLPVLMSIATVAQMRFQPKPADDSQAQTQKIMGMIMPVFMLWILYSYSAGLSLYILTSSLLGIFEYQVIRRIWPIDGAATPAKT
ncbi:MAG: YidC/Oxa1 family membrane protein insertase [Pseudohongiellaceae bacterium]|jgi:YidC/Oxa1 family membrane protein insertase